MAFQTKTWADRSVEYPGRRLLTATGTADTYDVTRAEGTVTTAGDAFSATNLNDLETRINAEFNARVLAADATVTVGSGGDYATINGAIQYLAPKRPVITSGDTTPRATINLLTGFTMEESVAIDGVDLSWITITGADAETTIDKASVTTAAFTVTNGGRSPIINQLFAFNATGATTPHGILATNGGVVLVGGAKGIKDSPASGAYIFSGSRLICGSSADFSGAASAGIWCNDGTVSAQGVVVSSSAYGLIAENGGRISAPYGVASDCTTTGVNVGTAGGYIDFSNGTATGCTSYGCFCYSGEAIILSANVQEGASPATTDITVLAGGTIRATGATGGVNQTVNVQTASGIIYR